MLKLGDTLLVLTPEEYTAVFLILPQRGFFPSSPPLKKGNLCLKSFALRTDAVWYPVLETQAKVGGRFDHLVTAIILALGASPRSPDAPLRQDVHKVFERSSQGVSLQSILGAAAETPRPAFDRGGGFFPPLSARWVGFHAEAIMKSEAPLRDEGNQVGLSKNDHFREILILCTSCAADCQFPQRQQKRVLAELNQVSQII